MVSKMVFDKLEQHYLITTPVNPTSFKLYLPFDAYDTLRVGVSATIAALAASLITTANVHYAMYPITGLIGIFLGRELMALIVTFSAGTNGSRRYTRQQLHEATPTIVF